uniref:Uncharacterized protein n=1 Tax=Leersia perrieri TaxID=77586 RepID=A0A0D9W7Q2_9ORYZ
MLPGGEDGKHRGAPAADEEAAATAASLNNLCATAGDAPAPAPFPRVTVWAVAALLAVGLGLGALVLAVVHSAALLVVAVLLSAAVVAFLLWNAVASASGRALRRFVDGMPASSLRAAADGQLVKITGLVACGDISLISSYEKVESCVYTSTLLKNCGRWGSEVANPKNRCSKWKLAHAERFAADFYITDAKSGMRLSVIGILSKKDGDIMILPPPEPISTGCVLLSFLLPTYFDGIVLRLVDRNYFMPKAGVS